MSDDAWSDEERRRARSLLLSAPGRFEAYHRSALFHALVNEVEGLLDLVAAECVAYEDAAAAWVADGAPEWRQPRPPDWAGLLRCTFGGDLGWEPLSEQAREGMRTARLAALAVIPLARLLP